MNVLLKKLFFCTLLFATISMQALSLKESFFKAVDLNDSDEVASLLAVDKSLANAQDDRGWTGLMRAASDGSIPVVKELLQAHADVNMADKTLGNTALHMAAGGGFTDIVKMLLAAQAEVNKLNKNGQTPLDLVIFGYSQTKTKKDALPYRSIESMLKAAGGKKGKEL